MPYGYRIADFGAGSGEYSLHMARHMGRGGSLYAFDALPLVLNRIRREAGKYDAEVFTLHADLNKHIPLRNNLVHTAIVSNLLHALHERGRFVSELKRVIAPKGRALIVDWKASFGNMGPTAEAVVPLQGALDLFENAGFKTGKVLAGGLHHYAFVATLPDSV